MFRKRERMLRCYLKCLIDAIVKLVNMKSKRVYSKIKAFNKLEKLNLVYPELLVCFGYEHYVTRTGKIVIHDGYLNKVKDKLIESYESEIDKKNRKQEIEILNFIGVK